MLLENEEYPQDMRVAREATALARNGYEVTVICQARGREPWYEMCEGVRVYRYPAMFVDGGVLSYLWEYGYSVAIALCHIKPTFIVQQPEITHHGTHGFAGDECKRIPKIGLRDLQCHEAQVLPAPGIRIETERRRSDRGPRIMAARDGGPDDRKEIRAHDEVVA